MRDNFIAFRDDQAQDGPAVRQWNVLVVDDDMDVHVTTRFCLSRTVIANRNLNLIDAYSGSDAIDLLKRHSDIDLILLDVVMETQDAGLEVARWLYEEGPAERRPKIIIRTGQPGLRQLSEITRNKHVNAVLQKSTINYSILVDAVTQMLQERDSDVVRH